MNYERTYLFEVRVSTRPDKTRPKKLPKMWKNLKLTCECYGTIHESERASYWKGVFLFDHIPLVHPLLAGRAKTGNEEYDFYKVDLSRISEDQLKEIAKRAAAKFGISEEAALSSAKQDGIPLKSDGVTVSWCDRHVRAAMPDLHTEDYEDDHEYDEEADDGDFW